MPRHDWSRCILHNGPDFVVVDKPPGVQVGGRVKQWGAGVWLGGYEAERFRESFNHATRSGTVCSTQVPPTVDNVRESLLAQVELVGALLPLGAAWLALCVDGCGVRLLTCHAMVY